MLNDDLFKGRFYFPNGDFYQGTFEDNMFKVGQYQQQGGAKIKCEQTTFANGEPDGVIDKAQKFGFVHAGNDYVIMGTFANGKPTGEVQLICGGATNQVQSPIFGEGETVVPVAAPTKEPAMQM